MDIMKRTLITPESGRVYLINHSSGRIEARFLYTRTRTAFGRNGKETKHYIFMNLRTNREIELKSRVKILRTAQ
jgi:hypothetical protein